MVLGVRVVSRAVAAIGASANVCDAIEAQPGPWPPPQGLREPDCGVRMGAATALTTNDAGERGNDVGR